VASATGTVTRYISEPLVPAAGAQLFQIHQVALVASGGAVGKVCICTRCADITILTPSRKNWQKRTWPSGCRCLLMSVLASTALFPKAAALIWVLLHG
jgi:hypothetical protein